MTELDLQIKKREKYILRASKTLDFSQPWSPMSRSAPGKKKDRLHQDWLQGVPKQKS